MKTYKYVLFDLDGTLTDPKLGITQCVQYALSKFNIHVNDLEELTCFIGPPLENSFQEYYGMTFDKAREAVEFYRERFRTKGMYENEVLEGVKELLEALKQEGFKLYIATSKPTIFATEILKYFNLDSYFISIIGSNLDGTRSTKQEIIEFILDSISESFSKSEVIMIGDRKHDINGANAVGIDSIGVTFGYGSEEELLNASPTYISKNIQEVLSVLLSKKAIIS